MWNGHYYQREIWCEMHLLKQIWDILLISQIYFSGLSALIHFGSFHWLCSICSLVQCGVCVCVCTIVCVKLRIDTFSWFELD